MYQRCNIFWIWTVFEDQGEGDNAMKQTSYVANQREELSNWSCQIPFGICHMNEAKQDREKG